MCESTQGLQEWYKFMKTLMIWSYYPKGLPEEKKKICIDLWFMDHKQNSTKEIYQLFRK